MSNRGGESTSSRLKGDEGDDFGRALSRIAVAQTCENVGFQRFKKSALDALTEVAIRYLVDLGKIANFHANLSARTQCNFFDIVKGFEDLGGPLGFSGASNSTNCTVSSGTVKEIVEFVVSTEEIPFPQPVPPFPAVRDKRLIPSFLSMNETPPRKHIPAWLPAFPDPHTFVHTLMWNERVVDLQSERIEQTRQKRKAERALLTLQQRLLSNGSAEASTTVACNHNVKELGVGEFNGSLARPLQPGEKAVTAVVLLDKLKDNFALAPVTEAAKEGLNDSSNGSGQKLLPAKRPAVHFSFKSGKKMSSESLDVVRSINGETTVDRWFAKEYERDTIRRA